MKLTALSSGIIVIITATSFAAPDPSKNPLLKIDLKSYVEKVPDDMTLEKMDSEGKGNPDMFTVFKTSDAGQRVLVRQMFDFNRDGKIDLANHFQKGKRVKSEYDLDYDGKIDSISEFNIESGELEKKTQIENNNLIWKYWHKSELRRKEVDRNGDGEPDMWVHYRNGRVVKTEIDVGFDGKNIRLEGNLNNR